MNSGLGEEPKEELMTADRQSVDVDIMELEAVDPETAMTIPRVFRQAVQDSLLNILGEDTAKALTIMIGDSALTDPSAVFSTLDSILHDPGSEILKGAIRAEFQVMVRQLLERLTIGHFAQMDSQSLEQEALTRR